MADQRDFAASLSIRHQMLLVYLLSLPGVGRRSVYSLLLAAVKNQIKPDAIWEWKNTYKGCKSISKKITKKVDFNTIEYFYYSLVKQLKQRNVSVLVIGQKEYPHQLLLTGDPPLVLYCQGDVDVLQKPAIGIVGSRKMTSYGAMVTTQITRQVVRDGFVTVSGCMYGVDATAHKITLAEQGITVGVLGYGFEHVYPRHMSRLQNDILKKGGVLISEYSPEVTPQPGLFVERNRIIAGLSLGVVVTEAAQKSGSHSTAICAAENGRAVFAVPGPVSNPYSEGTKWLINQGAQLITSGYEVAEALGRSSARAGSTSKKRTVEVVDVALQIVRHLESGPLSAEVISKLVKEPLSTVFRELSKLELGGVLVKDGILWYLKQA